MNFRSSGAKTDIYPQKDHDLGLSLPKFAFIAISIGDQKRSCLASLPNSPHFAAQIEQQLLLRFVDQDSRMLQVTQSTANEISTARLIDLAGKRTVGKRERRGQSERGYGGVGKGNVRESIQGNPKCTFFLAATSHSSRSNGENGESPRTRTREPGRVKGLCGQNRAAGKRRRIPLPSLGGQWLEEGQPANQALGSVYAGMESGGYLPSQKSNGNGNGKKSAMTPEEKEAWSQRRCMLGI